MIRYKPKSVDEYIAQFPPEVQKKLEQIRATIRKAAPKAEEKISYSIAGYKLNGMLVFFAAFKDHISLYPRPKTMKEELATFKGGKGTIQLPLDKPLPIGLITKVVKARMREGLDRTKRKKGTK